MNKYFVFVDCHRLLSIIIDCHRLLTILIDCHRLPYFLGGYIKCVSIRIVYSGEWNAKIDYKSARHRAKVNKTSMAIDLGSRGNN